MKRTAPVLTEFRHTKLCYSKQRYCGHPRLSGIFNYGGGELAVLHSHAPSSYRTPDDISHSFTSGYLGRAQVLLQRSLDHGETWPREHDVVVWDESLPLIEKRAIVARADEPGVARGQIDLTSPDAAVYFARPWTGPEDPDGNPVQECFVFRSADRGRTWETVPTRVRHPHGGGLWRDAHPLVQFPDGTLMGVLSLYSTFADGSIGYLTGEPRSVAVFGSDDGGLTWEYVAAVPGDRSGGKGRVYVSLILLPNGRLQCYMLNVIGIRNAIEMCYSDDGGYSWTEPRPIVAWGQSPWVARRAPGAARRGVHYRAPWPVRLRDGRIVVIFGRRKPPFGIGLIVSADDGATWSAEAVIRDDGSGADLSYPVATELDDGRIFTAYYFMQDDGNGFGGTRHIAGSFFRLA